MTTDTLFSAAGRRLRADARRQRWHDDPAGFARECIEWPAGSELTSYQAEALTCVADKGRLALRSPHGAGKTMLTALAVLWFATTRDGAGEDWKVVTTAGAWRQLEKYLWPEIHLWAKRIRWGELGLTSWRDGREIFDLALKLEHGQAFAAASDDPALLEGAHAACLLVCLDEAKSISAGVFDAVEGALSGPGEVFALAVSTPGEPAGRFYDICRHRPGLEDWAAQHVSLDMAVAAGRVSHDWADQRAAQWGRGSAVFANRVMGEFASGDEDGVIPLAWIEAAIERWRAWVDQGRPLQIGRLVIGVDVARFGTDKTVLATRRGDVVESVERHSLEDTMSTVGRVVAKLQHPSDLAVVDVIGLGSGVVDRLREQKKPVIAFNAAGASTRHDHSGELGYANQRAAAWWRMRELLDPARGATVALPDDDEMVGDLCSPHWKMTSSGKIQIEAKDEIRKRLGRSPDVGDAIVQAFEVSGGSSRGSSQGAVRWNGRLDPSGRTTAVPWPADVPPFERDPAWGPGALSRSFDSLESGRIAHSSGPKTWREAGN